MPDLTDRQLRVHLQSARKRAPQGPVYGFHAGDGQTTIDEIEIDGETWRVTSASSELALREVLVDTADADTPSPVAVLTPLGNRDLSTDVKARLARGELFDFDPWESLKMLFEASRVDARLKNGDRGKAFGRALLDVSQGEPFDPVPTGVLDPEATWNAFQRRGLAQQPPADDLSDWLVWATENPGAVTRLFSDYDSAVRSALRDRLRVTIGDEAPFLLAVLRNASRDDESSAGIYALALGLALDAARSAADADQEAESLWIEIRGQLKGSYSDVEIETETLEHFAKATGRAWRQLDDLGSDAASDVPETLDRVLNDLAGNTDDARTLASYSRFSETGWNQRVREVVTRVDRILDESVDFEALREALEHLEEHGQAQAHRSTVELLKSAARLAVWLQRADDPELLETDSLDRLARNFVERRSWADAVRQRVTAADPGAVNRSVEEVASRVVGCALDESDEYNERFAELLADELATQTDLPGGLGVHQVLERVVAPLADDEQVLLVVLDGLNWSVARSLLTDDALQKWNTFAPAHDDRVLPMYATVPSETAHSRTSLLTGELQPGKQHVEKKEFARKLRDQGAVDYLKEAELFHKGEVDAGVAGGLGPEVKDALVDENLDVVGVVVNAIDDQLSGADQVAVDWTVDAVTPLGSLLKHGGHRTVVLVGDHGHIWETDTDRGVHAPSARWREADEPPGDGERTFTGPAVEQLTGADEIVAAWSEQLRYTKHTQPGYHGGASMQEIVTPLLVLSRDDQLESKHFTEFSSTEPSWWRLEEQPEVVSLDESLHEASDGGDTAGQLDLLSDTPSGDISWVYKLLATERFQDQLDQFGQGLDAEVVGKVVANVAVNGGRLALASLADILGRNKRRTQLLLGTVRQVVNLDGYQALKFNQSEERVELDKTLLRKQFNLSN